MPRPKKKAKDRARRLTISFSKGGAHVEELRKLAGSLERSKVVDAAVLLAVRLLKSGKLERREDFHLGKLSD